MREPIHWPELDNGRRIDNPVTAIRVLAARSAYDLYQTDPKLAFAYPQLHDPSHPLTAKFLRALASLDSLEDLTPDYEGWLVTANEMIAAWEECEASAVATRLTGLLPGDQVIVEMALTRLSTAADPATDPTEAVRLIKEASDLVRPLTASPTSGYRLPDSIVFEVRWVWC